jgi:hypothetical protein
VWSVLYAWRVLLGFLIDPYFRRCHKNVILSGRAFNNNIIIVSLILFMIDF